MFLNCQCSTNVTRNCLYLSLLIYLHVGGTYKARSVDIKIDFPQDKHKWVDGEINLFAYILMALFNLEREVSLLFSFVG